MSIATSSVVFAVLALLAGASAVMLLVVYGRRRAPVGLRRLGLWVAWLAAATSTGGSLYYSEVAGYIPCDLCWWQRIAMYPLALVLLIAAVRGDRGVRRYVWPVALLGFLTSAYHYAIQTFPSLQGTLCAVDAPCTARWVEVFGFVSIPFMAMCGFALITAIMWTLTKETSS